MLTPTRAGADVSEPVNLNVAPPSSRHRADCFDSRGRVTLEHQHEVGSRSRGRERDEGGGLGRAKLLLDCDDLRRRRSSQGGNTSTPPSTPAFHGSAVPVPVNDKTEDLALPFTARARGATVWTLPFA